MAPINDRLHRFETCNESISGMRRDGSNHRTGSLAQTARAHNGLLAWQVCDLSQRMTAADLRHLFGGCQRKAGFSPGFENGKAAEPHLRLGG
jgi:hypothetical protein